MNKSFKIIRILIKKRITISTVESCTGGLLAALITSVNGSSKIFKFGLITYSNSEKIKRLNVSKKTLNKYGAVSRECCNEMLNGLSKMSNTNIKIAITGIAGPKGGTKKKPVGLVFIGIKKGKLVNIKKIIVKKGNRTENRKKFLQETINIISKII